MILIGILAVTAGIISATTLSSPQPVKVPAASIEITGSSGAIRIAHLGGDPLPPDRLVLRNEVRRHVRSTLTLDGWLGLVRRERLSSNGFNDVSNQRLSTRSS